MNARDILFDTRLSKWLNGEESTCNAGDTGVVGSIPGLGRSPGGRNGNLFQYSCLENSMDRGVWWAIVHRSQRVGHDRVNTHTHTHTHRGTHPNGIRTEIKFTWLLHF